MQNHFIHMKEQRENPETAAAGTKWTPEEELQLTNSIMADKSIDDIAKEHKRTAGGIKSRLREIAVRMIENEGKSIEEVSVQLRLTYEEIEDAQKRRAINKTTAPKSKHETELDVLKDIRKLLIQIEAKLLKE